jgi:hypothetical protein
MSKYRKKPVVIEAFLWTGDEHQQEDPVWIVTAIKDGQVRFEKSGTPEVTLLIDTLEGTHRAQRGDWIIKGVKGELYPCKPDIFAATYEPELPNAERVGGSSREGHAELLRDVGGIIKGLDCVIAFLLDGSWTGSQARAVLTDYAAELAKLDAALRRKPVSDLDVFINELCRSILQRYKDCPATTTPDTILLAVANAIDDAKQAVEASRRGEGR